MIKAKRIAVFAAVLVLAAVLVILTSCGDGASEGTVATKYGVYKGEVNDNGVISFKGIPYAQQPVGDLRWKEAQPLEESDEVVECYKYGNTPIQVEDEFEGASLTQMGEDCLTANVWTKDTNGKKPVMVWIYGGRLHKRRNG